MGGRERKEERDIEGRGRGGELEKEREGGKDRQRERASEHKRENEKERDREGVPRRRVRRIEMLPYAVSPTSTSNGCRLEREGARERARESGEERVS